MDSQFRHPFSTQVQNFQIEVILTKFHHRLCVSLGRHLAISLVVTRESHPGKSSSRARAGACKEMLPPTLKPLPTLTLCSRGSLRVALRQLWIARGRKNSRMCLVLSTRHTQTNTRRPGGLSPAKSQGRSHAHASTSALQQ